MAVFERGEFGGWEPVWVDEGPASLSTFGHTLHVSGENVFISSFDQTPVVLQRPNDVWHDRGSMPAPAGVGNVGYSVQVIGSTAVMPARTASTNLRFVTYSLDSPPTAQVDAPVSAIGGETFSLDATSSSDPFDEPLTYDWIVDGTQYTGPVVELTKHVPRDRVIDVSLTVSDAGGSTTVDTTVAMTRAEVSGYWMLADDSTVYGFGSAETLSVAADTASGEGAVDLEATPTGRGYWILHDDGMVDASGDADHYGDAVDAPLDDDDERFVSLSTTPEGDGYWIFTNRGRVLAFGAAVHHGDVLDIDLAGPVLDSVATPSGNGYYMVAGDGGVFALGDAEFRGSMGATVLDGAVVTLVPDPDGTGYWLFAEDGGVFAFDAPFRGSIPGVVDGPLVQPINAGISFGDGYLLVAGDGGIFNFSNQPFHGSLGGGELTHTVVAVGASRGDAG